MNQDHLDFLREMEYDTLLFKDSLRYESREWRPWHVLHVDHPVQRMLTTTECVFDFDGMNDIQKQATCDMLAATGLQFYAFESSDTGLHIHFWTDIRSHNQRVALVRHMARTVEENLGVQNDINPMRQGFIRCEWSYHPVKQTQKLPYYKNVAYTAPHNVIPDALRAKIGEDLDQPRAKALAGDKNGRMPKCVRFIWSNQFNDGRQRMVFILVSWFKASGKTKDETVSLVHEWAKRQGYFLPRQKIAASYNSSNGSVGCTYRHELIEELGFDINCDRKLK